MEDDEPGEVDCDAEDVHFGCVQGAGFVRCSGDCFKGCEGFVQERERSDVEEAKWKARLERG